MATSVARPVKRSDIKWKQMGKVGILLDLKTGDYFEMDEIALAIWKKLDGKTSLAKVASKLAKSYSAPQHTVEKDVVRFVTELRKRRLVDLS
jgi:coenzyme PQQ biosynthesis protein PqqD